MKLLFIKSFAFTLFLPGTVAVMIPLLITKEIVFESYFSAFFALLLMCIGTVIYVWCVWDFVVSGKGTPAPIDAPKHLVVNGLYCYTRNPMYVGVLCFIFGWVLLYTVSSMIIYAVCVALCFQLFVVFYEEPILQKQFGSEYSLYRLSVNRWLPKLLLGISVFPNK